VSGPDPGVDRRARGATLRVPFVTRCDLRFPDGRRESGLTVNVNELGAYVAVEALPQVGEAVECRFAVTQGPGQIRATGRVAWVNPRSPRLAGALPVGFGLQFDGVSDAERHALEDIVRAYLADRST
jgi:Tfp pilus assembly protein PilZ